MTGCCLELAAPTHAHELIVITLHQFYNKKTKPLKCSHPANRAILSGPKDGLISGSLLYSCKCNNFYKVGNMIMGGIASAGSYVLISALLTSCTCWYMYIHCPLCNYVDYLVNSCCICNYNPVRMRGPEKKQHRFASGCISNSLMQAEFCVLIAAAWLYYWTILSWHFSAGIQCWGQWWTTTMTVYDF